MVYFDIYSKLFLLNDFFFSFLYVFFIEALLQIIVRRTCYFMAYIVYIYFQFVKYKNCAKLIRKYNKCFIDRISLSHL